VNSESNPQDTENMMDINSVFGKRHINTVRYELDVFLRFILVARIQSTGASAADGGAAPLTSTGRLVRPEQHLLASRDRRQRVNALLLQATGAAFTPSALLNALVTGAYPIDVVLLLGLVFRDFDRFAGHISRVVMVLSGLLFTRPLLVRILVVGHGVLLLHRPQLPHLAIGL
jgi:hypothetical protein